jgi:hypothetical protein
MKMRNVVIAHVASFHGEEAMDGMEWKEEDGVVKWNSFERLDLGIIESTIYYLLFLFLIFFLSHRFPTHQISTTNPARE